MMKKLVAILLTLVMSVSLAACGGPDRQPAIDAFNTASTAFDGFVEEINANPDAYPQELIDIMVDMSALLTEYKTLLEGEDEIPQENLDEMTEWLLQVDDWVVEAKTAYGVN